MITFLLILVLVAVTLFCGYWLLVGLSYFIAFIIASIQLCTGKLTREQLAENAAKYKQLKNQHKQQQSHPSSSIIESILGDSSNKTIHIDIQISEAKEKKAGIEPYRSTIPCMDHNITY